MKKAGYHTANPGKTDYNIGGRPDKECWDHKGGKEYGWRFRKPGQPFFCVVNIGESHESRAHGSVGKTRNDPAKMKLFSYHPDLPVIRQNYAKYADAVENMDKAVGRCIAALKEDGLYEDTIIIYNSDHGGVMARSKRFAYHKNYMPYAPAGQHLAYLWKAPATPAWENHHQEGKTNEITGRFFRPRVSEEFYDNKSDFDNVHNLINKMEHQKKIAELKMAMREKQLELFDSGMLPEQMRMRRAAENKLTIYEMVRDRKLYPLKAYLDAADLALTRDKSNLDGFIKAMSDQDEGMRWWAVVGIHLLEKDAAPATAVLEQALEDESHEVRMMAAWTLVKLGKPDKGLACLEELLFTKATNRVMLHNVLDWMGEPALPLVKKHLEKGGTRNGRYGIGILGRIGRLQGW